VPVAGAVIVTTPQDLALADARKGLRMFEKVNVPVLGIVENMSWFENPDTGTPIPIFGSGGGERLAREVGLPLLGQIPLDPRVQEGGDTGRPIVVAAPALKVAQAMIQMAARVKAEIATRLG
jgi:ATP-binding protein involved in chromosome partitioning